MQSLPKTPESLAIVEMGGGEGAGTGGGQGTLYLNIGLQVNCFLNFFLQHPVCVLYLPLLR